MYPLNILNVGNTLLFKKNSEVTERQVVPLDGFRTMILALVIEDVLFDGRTKRALYTTRRTLETLFEYYCHLCHRSLLAMKAL
jgi:hypothetical protein